VNREEIIGRAQKDGRTLLTEIESKELIIGAGIAATETKLATSREDAVSISKEMGFPVALKVVSSDIVHKSDIGGVKLDLQNGAQVGKAYQEILAAVRESNPQAAVAGVSVQRMARPGVEVIIGMSKDPQFGPVIMFGLGGILVEILKDVSFRVVPLVKRDAQQMIREVKGYPLLEGYRGQEPADIASLEDVILKLSEFVEQNPEIKELDLNPIFANKDGAVAVDARIVLENEEK